MLVVLSFVIHDALADRISAGAESNVMTKKLRPLPARLNPKDAVQTSAICWQTARQPSLCSPGSSNKMSPVEPKFSLIIITDRMKEKELLCFVIYVCGRPTFPLSCRRWTCLLIFDVFPKSSCPQFNSPWLTMSRMTENLHRHKQPVCPLQWISPCKLLSPDRSPFSLIQSDRRQNLTFNTDVSNR